jgi:OmpA-OmpF porin, OOP family
LGGHIDEALASQGASSSTTAKQSSTNLGLKLGYKINPNFAVEASYDSLGGRDVSSSLSAPTADTAAGSWKSHGLGLHAVGILPIDSKWSVYGSAGLVRWGTSLDLVSNAGGSTAVSASSSNTALALGAGGAYAIMPNMDLTAGLVHMSHVGDAGTTGRVGTNSLSMGLRYHFL